MSSKYSNSFKFYFLLHAVFVFIIIFSFFLLIHFKNQSLQRSVSLSNLHENVKEIVDQSKLLHRKNISTEELKENINNLLDINKEALEIQSLLGSDELHQKREEIFNSFKANPYPEKDLSKEWEDYAINNDNFLKFVRTNYWKTLTGITKRVVARTSLNFDWNRFPFDVVKNNTKDYEQIISVTNESGLKADDKNQIISYVTSLIGQLDSLRTNLVNSRDFRENHNEFIAVTDKWVQRWHKSSQRVVTPEFKFVTFKDALTLFFVVLVSLFLFYLLGKKIFLYYQGLSESEKVANFRDLILHDNINFINDGSFEFQNSMKSLREHLKKKFSFSKIFQSSVPFPALLVDEKMKYKWHNNFFGELVKFNSSSENVVSEINDFFVQNLEKMISDTLDRNEPAIYKITTKEEKSFQIYITPVESYNSSFVMLCLTSLDVVENSISTQATSLLESLDYILENIDNEDFDINELSNDFSKKEVALLYEKVLDFVSYRNNKSVMLEKNVNTMTSDLDQMKETLEKINSINLESLEVYQGMSSKFIDLKNALTESVEMNETLYLHQLTGSQLLEELSSLVSSPSHSENISLFLEKSLDIQKKFAEYEEEVIDHLKEIVDSTKLIASHLNSVSHNVQDCLGKEIN